MIVLERNSRIENLSQVFSQRFGSHPEFVVAAPGRVNLIGEHTDYNEGFVLPVAIDREMLIAARRNGGSTVNVFSADYQSADVFDLKHIRPNVEQPWANYLRGSLHVLLKDGFALHGFDAVLSGNVPQGAGLSSSAAYEVAVITLACALSGTTLDGKTRALLAQKAENEFIGVQCGIMDQFISALGRRGFALFLDCRSLEFQQIPLNLEQHDAAVVITNSGVKRGLVDSAYNARRDECDQGRQILSTLLGRQMSSLRDISEIEFRANEQSLPDTVARRCRHVITENARVEAAVSALSVGDLTEFGKLMNASHISLRDDFQVSHPDVDLLVDLTWRHPDVMGCRMTGAGFGGCTVAIMARSAIDSYISDVVPKYTTQTKREAQVFVCRSENGAEIVGGVPQSY